MAIIDQEGLFKGKRLRKCSAAARWRWPYLFLLSNGYARIELDYECIADEFSSFRESAPTPDELRETFAEFRENHLLYVYKVNDQEWGQWDCRRTWLKDYKTTADNVSPKPPENEYQQWLREQHGEEWREFHWNKGVVEEAFDQNSPKACPNLAQSFGAERYGVGVGDGKGKEEPFDPSFDGSEAFENSVAIFPTERRDYDPMTQKLYFEAIGEIRKPGNLSSSEAVAKLDAASRSYVAKKGEFCVAFSKYLRNGVWRGESAPVKMQSVAAIMGAKAKECGVDLNALSAAKREQVTL